MKLTPKEKRKRDRVFSKLILARDNRICRWCGKKDGKKDCSHIINREFLPLRWSPENAITLCFRCHKCLWHKNPLLASKWIRSELGDAHCDKLLDQC
jgi:5-methylcytosine-specific restriction endonuclease McrA